MSQSKFLTGDELTYADVLVAINMGALIGSMDKKCKKQVDKLTGWLKTIFSNPAFIGVYGEVSV